MPQGGWHKPPARPVVMILPLRKAMDYSQLSGIMFSSQFYPIECYQDVELTEDSRMTLDAWLDRWLAEYKEGTIRLSTLESYRNYIENYIKPQLGGKQVSLITTQDVQRMYQRLKTGGRVREDTEGSKQLSDSTVRHMKYKLIKELYD